MAEKRMISRSISISKKFNMELNDHFSRLLYVLLIPHSDDFGRLNGDPFKIKGLILPMMEDIKFSDVDAALKNLHNAELIVWYEADGEKFIQIVNFDAHQQGLHKRTRSKFPDPPGISRKFPEIPSELKGTELNRTEEKGTEGNGSEGSAHALDDIIKERLRVLCLEMKIQGFTAYHLNIVYSYLGTADIEVIESIIMKSQYKPNTYLINTLHGVINVDKVTRADQLPGAKVGDRNAEHGRRDEGIQPRGTSPASAAESITGGKLGWIRPQGNVVQMPSVQG